MQRNFLFDFDPQEAEREIQLRAPKSSIRLRPYQQEAVSDAFKRWEAGDVSTLVCLPTGTGKSVVFSEVMRRWSERN